MGNTAIGIPEGKQAPYLVLALMHFAFRVPVHGSLSLLAGLSLVYLLALWSLGLVVSAAASTQMEATQIAQMVLLPSIMLSGYIFPLASLPAGLRVVSCCLPATHFIPITRGIIVRGAGIADLWIHTVSLLGIAFLLLLASARVFKKTTA